MKSDVIKFNPQMDGWFDTGSIEGPMVGFFIAKNLFDSVTGGRVTASGHDCTPSSVCQVMQFIEELAVDHQPRELQLLSK